MFKNWRFKKILISTLVFMLLLSTVVVAASNIYEKKLTATHGRIKFKVDGKDVTKEIEGKYGTPAFTVHEYGYRSYVPVRAIADLMGLEIKYDDSTHTAEIIDPKKSEIYEKDVEIAKLKQEVIILERELESLKKDVVVETDLKTLEKKLNKEYGTYENIEFDIVLKENKNNINVSIEVDFYDTRNQSYWNRMTYSNKKTLVEDITDMISKEFTNADITGSIYDNYYRRDLLTFSKKKGSSVSISYRDYRDNYRYDELLDDAEYYLDANLRKYFVVSEISIRERYDGEIYGTIRLKDEGQWIRDVEDDVDNALYYAESSLIDRYGSSTYFDIEVFLGSRKVGTYYNGELR